MNIEKALADRIGPAGAKLHSGHAAEMIRSHWISSCICGINVICLLDLLDGVRRGFVVLARPIWAM